MVKLRIAIGWMVLLAGARALEGKPTLPPALRDVGFDQRLGAQVPLELEFTDEAGQQVKLADYFHDKPVILVLAYYRCPMLCTMVLNGLAQGMLDVPFALGKDFVVVTVSFDPRETPQQAAAKKKTYLTRYGGGEQAAAGWHFLTGKAEPIATLTAAVGFRYSYNPALDQFAHASGIMLVTPAGKISHYFYDVKYSGRDLRLGLVEASENKIGSPVDKILLYCFHYDPLEGTYGATIINFIRAGGVLTVLVLSVFLGLIWKQERRREHSPRAEALNENPQALQRGGS